MGEHERDIIFFRNLVFKKWNLVLRLILSRLFLGGGAGGGVGIVWMFASLADFMSQVAG
jgi:hypothetical protein